MAPPETRRLDRGHDFYPPAAVLDAVPTIEQVLAVDRPVSERIVHLHYCGPVGDWWLTALDRGPSPWDWVGHGFVRLTGHEQFAEWGDVWLPELEQLHIPGHPQLIIERDLGWTPTPFGRIRALR